MATTPLFSHSLFTLPFSHATDFTELADNCERFVEGLVECHDPVKKTGDLCTSVGLSGVITTDLNGACTAASTGQPDGRNLTDPFSPFRA